MERFGDLRQNANMLKTKEKPAPNSLRRLRKERDLTMEQVGQMIGTDASTVNKLEKGIMRLTDRWIGPYVEAFGVSADELLRAEPEGARHEVRKVKVDVPDRHSMPRDLPIRGTAAGSHLRGAFIEGEIVDYGFRPHALLGAMNAYGLYIEGESMIPEHNPGDLRIVHPDRPVRVGDSVVVQVQLSEHGPIESTIGRLVRRTEKSVIIGKHNPPSTVELKRETVKAIHRVLPLNELFGL